MISNSTISTVLTTVLLLILATLVLARCAATPAPKGGPLDTTDDYRALGYSNQRKIVRNSQGDMYVVYRKKCKGSNGTA